MGPEGEWVFSIMSGRLPTFSLSMLQIAAAVGLFAWRLGLVPSPLARYAVCSP